MKRLFRILLGMLLYVICHVCYVMVQPFALLAKFFDRYYYSDFCGRFYAALRKHRTDMTEGGNL